MDDYTLPFFRLPCVVRQPETFAKSATDGASAARRHISNQQNHVESHLATSRRYSILGFRLPYGVGLGSLKLIFGASKMPLHGGECGGLITAGKRV